VVEHLGNEILVYLEHAGTTLTARFPPEMSVQPEQSVDVVFDPSNLHLFDEGTGNALGHSRSATA
jgi:multiple sugar transport system ATP-binding protein